MLARRRSMRAAKSAASLGGLLEERARKGDRTSERRGDDDEDGDQLEEWARESHVGTPGQHRPFARAPDRQNE